MTPLRQKMIRELELQRLEPSTVHQYVTAVVGLAQFYHRSPDKISCEEVRDYLHYLLVDQKLAAPTINCRVVAIRFFYRRVLGLDDFQLDVRCKRPGKLPEPISREEVGRLFDATNNLKHRVLLMTTYGGGLRGSEVVRLQPRHIHSDRMLIRIEQSKRNKDRYTLLSPSLLDYLGRYTHRVAISNHRLLSMDNDRVSFHWRDRSNGNRQLVASLPVPAFIRRFLHHVLPKGFMRIRHYGFLANRVRKQALARCRELLHVPKPTEEPPQRSVAEMVLLLTGNDITRCPKCGAPLKQEKFDPGQEPSPRSLVPYLDSS